MCDICNKNKCCCPKVISKTGPQGKPGRDGRDGKDGSLLEIRFDPTPSQVRSAFSTPIAFIPAPGVGKAIAIESVTARRKFVTTGYTSNGIIITSQPTSGGQFGTVNTFLSAADAGFAPLTSISVNMLSLNALVFNVYENAPVYFEVGTADSLVGDDLITVWVRYRILKF